jgi:Na+/alanine symporter
MMIFSMAIPNLIGVVALGGEVRRALDDYWRRYQAGEFEPGQR